MDELHGITILDPVERLVFKLSKRGIRRFDDTGAPATMALPKPTIDAAFQANYLLRQSYRHFVNASIPLPAFSQFLAS